MNSKDGTADGTSGYAMNLRLYKTFEPSVKKKLGAGSASETTQKNRMIAVGKTSESSGYTSLSHTSGNMVSDALRRVRSSGSTVPRKIGMKNLQPDKIRPNPPTNLIAIHGNGSANISFTPGSDGNDTITNYYYSFNGTTFYALSPEDSSSPITITGLTNGTTYSIYLKAKNSMGLSLLASSAVIVTPSTIPSAPASITALESDQSVTISFTQTSNGGSSITDYLYSFDDETYISLGDTTSPITINNLTNDTTYTIYLKAQNINGLSSSASISVTPHVVYSSDLIPSLSGKNILLQLQGNDSNSYSGNGYIWYDVSPKISSGYRSIYYNGALVGSGINYDGEEGSFDFSSNSYINIPNSVGLQANNSQYRSFVVWAYIVTEQSDKGLFSKMYGSPSYDGFMLRFMSNRNLSLAMNGSTRNDYFSTTANNVYNLNEWQMFTGVVCFGGNTSHPSRIYVNSTNVGTGNSLEVGIGLQTAPIRVPSGIQEGNTFADCRIGAIYYFDGELTSSDVSTIYESTKVNYGL
jgi:hypothetical protein